MLHVYTYMHAEFITDNNVNLSKNMQQYIKLFVYLEQILKQKEKYFARKCSEILLAIKIVNVIQYPRYFY